MAVEVPGLPLFAAVPLYVPPAPPSPRKKCHVLYSVSMYANIYAPPPPP